VRWERNPEAAPWAIQQLRGVVALSNALAGSSLEQVTRHTLCVDAAFVGCSAVKAAASRAQWCERSSVGRGPTRDAGEACPSSILRVAPHFLVFGPHLPWTTSSTLWKYPSRWLEVFRGESTVRHCWVLIWVKRGRKRGHVAAFEHPEKCTFADRRCSRECRSLCRTNGSARSVAGHCDSQRA
jgi:hypothetical protein